MLKKTIALFLLIASSFTYAAPGDIYVLVVNKTPKPLNVYSDQGSGWVGGQWVQAIQPQSFALRHAKAIVNSCHQVGASLHYVEGFTAIQLSNQMTVTIDNRLSCNGTPIEHFVKMNKDIASICQVQTSNLDWLRQYHVTLVCK